MLITRESEYAMRMIRALADNEIRSVRKICDDEQLPYKWAYKILKKMEHSNIVKSFYGVKGGYRLAKEISQITMLDILTINENNLRFNKGANSLNNTKSAECTISKELRRLENVIRFELRERTMDRVIGEIELIDN